MQFLTYSVKIFLSDVYAGLREVEKIKERGIEISVMELNSVKLCNCWHIHSSSSHAVKPIGQVLLIPTLADYA